MKNGFTFNSSLAKVPKGPLISLCFSLFFSLGQRKGARKPYEIKVFRAFSSFYQNLSKCLFRPIIKTGKRGRMSMQKILVVEDDPVINQVIREFLSDHGYEVTSVFDGKAALE